MKRFSAIALLATVTLLGGCATKKYVSQQIQPVQKKVDDLSASLDQTNKKLDDTNTRLNATDETAKSADANASKALSQLGDVNGKVDSLNSQVGAINSALGNLDDYKAAGTVTVNFAFNKAKLSSDAMATLDQFVSGNLSTAKRYFIALQGYTDQIGGVNYNLALSRRRAEAVQTYLISKHSIPVFRVQMVGFGKADLVDPAMTKAARAKNRRVDVTLYTAPEMASGSMSH